MRRRHCAGGGAVCERGRSPVPNDRRAASLVDHALHRLFELCVQLLPEYCKGALHVVPKKAYRLPALMLHVLQLMFAPRVRRRLALHKCG